MSEFQVYLILQATGIKEAFIILTFLFSVLSFVAWVVSFQDEQKEGSIVTFSIKYKLYFTLIFGLFFVLAIFMPTTRELVLIKTIPAFTGNVDLETLCEIPSKLIEFVDAQLKHDIADGNNHAEKQ